MKSLYFTGKSGDNNSTATAIKLGQRFEIKAQPGQTYNLIDPETSITISDIGAERIEEDLLLI